MDAKVHNSESHLHKWVSQLKNNPYKYYPTYRAIDCAKELINDRLVQASISNINKNGRRVSYEHRMDPC